MKTTGYAVMNTSGDILRRFELYEDALNLARDTNWVIVYSHEAIGDLTARKAVVGESLRRRAEMSE